MSMIPAKNVKKFIHELENIFNTLHLDNTTLQEVDKIMKLYLDLGIRQPLKNEITEEIAIAWHIKDVQSITINKREVCGFILTIYCHYNKVQTLLTNRKDQIKYTSKLKTWHIQELQAKNPQTA